MKNRFFVVMMRGVGEEKGFFNEAQDRWKRHPDNATHFRSRAAAQDLVWDLEGHIAYELVIMLGIKKDGETRLFET